MPGDKIDSLILYLKGNRTFDAQIEPSAQRLDRWDEIIRPADRLRVPGQRISNTILCSSHVSEPAGQSVLVAAEAHKHCPMLGSRPAWGIAAEDMSFDSLLFDRCARDIRCWAAYLFSQLDSCLFGSPDD